MSVFQYHLIMVQYVNFNIVSKKINGHSVLLFTNFRHFHDSYPL